MKFKNIIKKFIKSTKTNKINSDDNYCYSNIIWNTDSNLIILISFTENYFEQIIEIQDVINTSQLLNSKIIYSSYEEVTDKLDEDGDPIVIIHKKYYMLIGGYPCYWNYLYTNIHNLGNPILSKITDEIVNNCDSKNFSNLIYDGILHGFKDNIKYEDKEVETVNGYIYTDPKILLNRLPSGFTGRDILKFIRIFKDDNVSDAYYKINIFYNMKNADFYKHELYPLYSVLFNNLTIEKLCMALAPLYNQIDDDSIPGDVSDESLDEIFREKYERFSAVADNFTLYEDIDEVLSDDEESDNMRKEDIIE